MKNLILLFSIMMVVFFSACSKDKTLSKEPLIATSTFTLYDITTHIAQNRAKVVHILPFGVSPHSFEPTPKLMANLEKSSLVIYSGAGLEPWLEHFTFKNKTLNISKFVKLRKLTNTDHKHLVYDPHYWLDINNMKIATKVITKELIKILPKDKEFFTANRDSFLKELEELEMEFRSKLKSCKKDTLVVNHNAFSYIAKQYNFKTIALSGLIPEAQPSAKNIKNILNHIKRYNVNTIFFEHFVNDKTMKTIAKDANINIDVLQPLGNVTADEVKQNLGYIGIMRKNLEKISKALECQ